MATTLEDIQQDIIQKHILPHLDGPSLRTIATATASSAHLRSLCSDHKLWADVSMSTWPSITHPRVHQIISTFPKRHYSFFQDSFPSLFTYRPSYYLSNSHQKDHPFPSELISLVDIRYKGDIIYSTAHFANTTSDHFLSSPFQIVLNESTHVPEKFNELEISNNEASLSLLKESVTLNWIIINPTQKRAGNLSVIKPVSVSRHGMCNEVVLKYITVLPGFNPNEMVKCNIKLVLLDANYMAGDTILQVKEVSLKLLDLVFGNCLNGKDFMVVTQRAFLEENNVRRIVIDDERRLTSHMQLKKIKRDQKDLARKKEEKTKFVTNIINFGLLSFLFCYYIYLFCWLVY